MAVLTRIQGGAWSWRRGSKLLQYRSVFFSHFLNAMADMLSGSSAGRTLGASSPPQQPEPPSSLTAHAWW